MGLRFIGLIIFVLGSFTMIARTFLYPLTRERNRINLERKRKLYGWKWIFMGLFIYKGDREIAVKRFFPPKNIWDWIGSILVLIGVGLFSFG